MASFGGLIQRKKNATRYRNVDRPIKYDFPLCIVALIECVFILPVMSVFFRMFLQTIDTFGG